MKLYWTLLAACLAVTLLASTAAAQEEDAALIHSDEPLWAPGQAKVWPQSIANGEEIGCANRMQLGLWRFSAADDALHSDAWSLFSNYGAFHCLIYVAESDQPGEFEASRPGFLIELGRAGDSELWALQIGARPGSDYLLLSRPPSETVITSFNVLQRRCPRGQVRGGPGLDILITEYCSINTRAELLSLARRMAKLPALGVLSFQRETPDVD